MRSKPLIILGSLVVMATLIIVACDDAGTDSPLALRLPDLVTDEARIPADGISNVDVTVTVLATDGKKAENVPIEFTARALADTSQDLGTLSHTSVLTNSEGVATVTLTSIESSRDTTSIVRAAIGDTTGTGVRVNPKTGAVVPAVSAPPGAVVIVSPAPLDEEELEARLHHVLLQRATEKASERQRGLSSILGQPQTGEGAGAQAIDLTQQMVVFEGVVISLTSSKSELPADGVSTAAIEARVRTSRGINVQSMPLVFSAAEGKITSTATTDQFGSATATLTAAITDSTDDTIVVRMGYTLTETIQVQYVQPVLTISSDDATLAADGSSTTTLRARLLTPDGNPVAGASVAFSLTGPNDASITVQGTTSSSGEATAILKAGGTAGTATITAGFSSLTAATAVELLGLNITLTSANASIQADGESSTTITLVAKTQTTNVAVVGQEVTFATDLGTIPATATTNASGIATVDLTSGNSPGTATVTATLGSVSVTTPVSFTAKTLILSIAAEEGSILRDGLAEVDITVVARDPIGNLLNGQDVTWTLTGGGDNIWPTSGQTGQGLNPSGSHTTTLTADASTTDATATITATVGDSTASVDIDLAGVSLTSIVEPDTILANGSESALISWQATETTSGRVIPSHQIAISKVSGPNVTLTSMSSQTSASGIATVTVTSTTNAGDLVMEAELGGVTQQENLHLLADQFSLTLTSDESTLLRDGAETAELKALVLDKRGYPVTDQRVDFALISGSGTLEYAFKNTNSSGEATVDFTADVASTNVDAVLQAFVGTIADTLNVPLYGVIISISTNPDSLVADRESEVEVEVTVKEAGTSTPLTGRTVYFAVGPGTYGTITGFDETDNRGVAVATLTGDTTASFTGTVYGRLGDDPTTALVDNTTLSIVAPVRNVSLTSADEGVLRNNLSSTTLTARVSDNSGFPVESQSVAWSLIGATPAGASLSVSSSRTNSTGDATVILTGDAGSTDATATVQAAVGSDTATFDVTLQGVTISIEADPGAITANGVDVAEIEATLRETVSGRGIAGETVTFSTTLGTIGGTDETDANGKATVNLISGRIAGTAVVKAYNSSLSAGIIDSVSVVISDPVAGSVELLATPDVLQPKGTGGTESSTITATIRDDANEPIPSGVAVAFALSPSNAGTFEGGAAVDTVLTDSGGVATTSFQSGTVATPVTISAVVVGTSIQSSDAILAVAAGPVAHLDIAVTPISWNDDGLYERELHIVVTDTFSNAVANQLILWRGEPDSLENAVRPIGEESRTDETGVAHSLLIYNRGMEPIEFTVIAEAENGVSQSRTLGDGYVSATVGSNTLLRDGLDYTSLSATVQDLFGTKVGLVSIGWSNPSGIGTLAGSASITDQDGESTGSFLYQGDASNSDTTATVYATYMSTLTDSVTFNLKGVSLDVSASPDTVSANGITTSVVSARFFETTSGRNLAGYTVGFAAKQGSITGSADTGAGGVATVAYTAPTATGTDTLIATYGGISDTTFVEVVASASASIALSASVDSLAVLGTGGIEMSTITATVRDAYGQLVPAGTAVQMVASTGTFSNGAATITRLTNASGQANFTYQSGATAGSVTFTATSGTASAAAPLVTIQFGAATQVLLTTDTSAPGDNGNGSYTIPVAALVSDASGNMVDEGSLVFFDITVGGTFAQITPWVATDEDGIADATLVFPAASSGQNVTVRATIGGVSQTLVILLP